MAKLIYASNMSLDGWTEDERGAFDWVSPDDDVFAFITKLMRSAGTYLYGRRMYETMAVWETDPTLATQSDLTADYANAWQAADKVVYSSTLTAPSTANTQLERRFEPSAVHQLKAAAAKDLVIGGPSLAAQALVAGLVDELALFVWPVVLAGRKPALPTGSRAELGLVDEHRFSSGVVYLRYCVQWRRQRIAAPASAVIPAVPPLAAAGTPSLGWKHTVSVTEDGHAWQQTWAIGQEPQAVRGSA